MEWYHIKIKWWFDDTNLHCTHCVIPAKSYGEALDEVLKDYLPDEIEEIQMWQDEDRDLHGFTIYEDEGDNEE